MPNICGHISKVFKTFKLLFHPKQRVTNSKNPQNVPFRAFFDPERQLSSIMTKTSKEDNAKIPAQIYEIRFIMIFTILYRGSDIPKIVKMNFSFASLGDPDLSSCQELRQKRLKNWKVKENWDRQRGIVFYQQPHLQGVNWSWKMPIFSTKSIFSRL